MATLTYTTVSNIVNGNVNNASDVSTAFTQVQASVNSVADSQIASPNNLVPRTIATAPFIVNSAFTAGNYSFQLAQGGLLIASGGLGAPYTVPLDTTSYAVTGKTTQLIVRVSLLVSVGPSITFTFGLYPITSVGGTTNAVVTLGTVTTGSTIAFASPGSGTNTFGASSQFNVPGSGVWVPGVALSGTMPAGTQASGLFLLQVVNV